MTASTLPGISEKATGEIHFRSLRELVTSGSNFGDLLEEVPGETLEGTVENMFWVQTRMPL